MDVGHAGCGYDPDNTMVSGMQKVDARLAVMARGSVKSSHGARGTCPHIFERYQSGDTVAAQNHVHQMQGAQMRVPCFSEEKAQQLPRIGRTSLVTCNMFELWAKYLRLVDNQSKTGK